MVKWLLPVFALVILASCCDDPVVVDPSGTEGDLRDIPYAPTGYVVETPAGYPMLEVPAENPMTVEGVQLGRKLFFDPILSKDSTMSCSSCHHPEGSFTDNLAVSTGVEGMAGKRSAMSLLDIAFHYNGLFWDGRAATLEEQALMPVEDHLELNALWPDIEERLRMHPSYPQEFRKAFGIKNTSEITKELAAKALAQFERILVSSGESRFDKFLRREIFLTDSEFDGYLMFFDKRDEGGNFDAQCGHCHAAPLLTTTEFKNNGIQNASGLDDFADAGKGAVTGVPQENGTFKIPTLRNIALTAPYMHDGRFSTLEEVLDHYNSGGHSPQLNKDALIYPLELNTYQKKAILDFLHTLTDTSFVKNPAFSSPF